MNKRLFQKFSDSDKLHTHNIAHSAHPANFFKNEYISYGESGRCSSTSSSTSSFCKSSASIFEDNTLGEDVTNSGDDGVEVKMVGRKSKGKLCSYGENVNSVKFICQICDKYFEVKDKFETKSKETKISNIDNEWRVMAAYFQHLLLSHSVISKDVYQLVDSTNIRSTLVQTTSRRPQHRFASNNNNYHNDNNDNNNNIEKEEDSNKLMTRCIPNYCPINSIILTEFNISKLSTSGLKKNNDNLPEKIQCWLCEQNYEENGEKMNYFDGKELNDHLEMNHIDFYGRLNLFRGYISLKERKMKKNTEILSIDDFKNKFNFELPEIYEVFLIELCAFHFFSYFVSLDLKIDFDPKNILKELLSNSDEIKLSESEDNINQRKYRKRIHRKVFTAEQLANRPFHCGLCSAAFARADSLRRHSTSLHMNDRPYKCSECPMTYTQKHHLVKHIKMKHRQDGNDEISDPIPLKMLENETRKSNRKRRNISNNKSKRKKGEEQQVDELLEAFDCSTTVVENVTDNYSEGKELEYHQNDDNINTIVIPSKSNNSTPTYFYYPTNCNVMMNNRQTDKRHNQYPFQHQMGQLTKMENFHQTSQLNDMGNVHDHSKTINGSTKLYVKTITNILDRLLDNYDKARTPPTKNNTPVNILIDFHVNSVGPISEQDMTFKMDCYMRQTWTDPRLAFDGPEDELSVSIRLLEQIWRPDTFIHNGLGSYIHTIPQPNKLIRLRRNGTIVYSMRLTIRSSCHMNLKHFPMDTQVCPLFLGNAYYDDEVIYRWKMGINSSVKFETNSRGLSQFDLIKAPLYESYMEGIAGNFSILQINFYLIRHMGYFLLQVYLPCTLLVFLSWVGFFLNREATSDRIALGVYTVFTITFLTLEARNDLPKVPYTTALDYYLWIAFFFVFSTMFEFACVHYFTKYGSGEYVDIYDPYKKTIDVPLAQILQKEHYFSSDSSGDEATDNELDDEPNDILDGDDSNLISSNPSTNNNSSNNSSQDASPLNYNKYDVVKSNRTNCYVDEKETSFSSKTPYDSFSHYENVTKENEISESSLNNIICSGTNCSIGEKNIKKFYNQQKANFQEEIYTITRREKNDVKKYRYNVVTGSQVTRQGNQETIVKCICNETGNELSVQFTQSSESCEINKHPIEYDADDSDEYPVNEETILRTSGSIDGKNRNIFLRFKKFLWRTFQSIYTLEPAYIRSQNLSHSVANRYPTNSGSRIDSAARLLYPLTFTLINIIYWIVYLSNRAEILEPIH
ncbi:hypothetical protein SNEBB_003982 [Seison nebaliae]|nr:hypothetical protein SNEBB_003982 [Seison nebaliae]